MTQLSLLDTQRPTTSLPLNPPQADAVAHVDGPLIVFAGAGSGKTRVITYRIANLVARHQVPPHRILAVTFTNKAAGEMRERLADLLGEDLTHNLWLGTFHAICVRLLRRFHEEAGLSRNFVIYDDSDQKALMKRIMKDLALDDRRYAPAALLSRIHREKQEGRGPEEMSIDSYVDEIALRCFREYERRLESASACDFEDLLLKVLRLAEDRKTAVAEELANRFEYILVDEFQDTNMVQYRLVKAMSRLHGNLCVVGDDDQSIYRWRGADVRNIRNFTSDYPDARLIKLEQNYRSTKNIVSGALAIIRRASLRQPKELWSDNEQGQPIHIVHCSTERDEAGFVVSGLRQALAAGLNASELAIFYRTHAQSRVLEEALRSEDIPYQIVGGTRFFDRAEVKDILSYLRVLLNPQSDVDLLRIINKPPRKIGKKTIEELVKVTQEDRCTVHDATRRLLDLDRLGTAAKKSLVAFVKLIDQLQDQAKTASVHELTSQILDDTGYIAWLQRQDSTEADARIENLQELVGSMAEYEEDCAEAGTDPDLNDYLTRVALMSAVDTMEDTPRVPMMTIHAAKGLEFDAVWLTGMEERLFPLRGQEIGQEEELEEERRLAYVAITRARKQLFITHTNTRMLYGQMRYNQGSRFLSELPAEVTQRAATQQLQSVSQNNDWSSSATSRRSSHTSSRPTASPKPARKAGERYIERDAAMDLDDGCGDFDAQLRAGSRVSHKKFGVGVVTDIRQGPDPTLTVKFPGWPPKQIKLSFLRPA